MKLTANLIGATGLVGKQLLFLLLKNEKFEKIRIFVRRDAGIQHPKLEQYVIDFSQMETWEKFLTGDVLFSALGTTLKQAGSKVSQYETDFTFNLNVAKIARENSIKNYILVSSIGANPESPLFYPRMKGELDGAVSKLNFENLAIMRPASLTGKREKKRWVEILSVPVVFIITKFFLKKYRPIKDIIVARAMINAVLFPDPVKTIWESHEIFTLAEKQ